MDPISDQNESSQDINKVSATRLPTSKSTVEIQAWLVAHIAEALFLDPKEIGLSVDFNSYGLSSRDAIVLSGDLEEWLGRRLSPTLLYEYPSILLLSNYLAQNSESTSSVVESEEAGSASSTDPLHSGHVVQPRDEVEPIAVIGLECRFPGAENQEAYWNLLITGAEAITEIPIDRWNADDYYDPMPGKAGKMVSRLGGFIKDFDIFDAQFFGISPREALQMDPQQRLLLQTTWRALENASIVPAKIAGTATGVYIGISTNDYATFNKGDIPHLDVYTGTGNAMCIAANRISYFYDLRGPSVALDTACSSSLVAVHMAVESLRKGESNLAIAGGVNLILSPELNVVFSQAGMLSPDGRCKTFDAAANGYVRGEGCAVVILKRLSDALTDGDVIRAVIRGSAVNQDGKSNGLTAPNGLAQQEVIRQALTNAGIGPNELGYIEAHGTGTALGDPIEMNALAAVMQARSKENPCFVGSVKTNFGHLESAAGIAGLIKALLSIENETIPAHLHFHEINPFIPISEMPIRIPSTAVVWPRSERPRFAGISSFGFGGTNSHVIISEAPLQEKALTDGDGHSILCVSAKDPLALRENVKNIQSYLQANEAKSIGQICAAQNLGRTHFEYRTAWLVPDRTIALEKIGDYLALSASIDAPLCQSPSARKVAFLFTGQGSQYTKMGFDLYQSNPIFKRHLDECKSIADQYLKRSLLSVLFEEENLINETEFTQPALFALEYSLAQVLISSGILPDFVMGHSLGEYVAATIAGVMSLENGLRLVIERARLMQNLPSNGEMAAVFTSRTIVQEMIKPYRDEVSIAAINGPNHTVISGRKEKVRELTLELEAKGITVRFLTVSHAFHSPMMDEMLEPFRTFARGLSFQGANIPIVSNLTGRVLEPGFHPDEDYWVQHIRQPVNFQENILELLRLGCDTFLEIGPHSTLIGMGKRCLTQAPETDPQMVEWIATLQKDSVDSHVLSEALINLYIRGLNVNWAEYASSTKKVMIPGLPRYSFQGEKYRQTVTPESRAARPDADSQEPIISPFLGKKIETPTPWHIFQSEIPEQKADDFFVLSGGDLPLFSPAVIMAFALQSANQVFGEGKFRLLNLQFPGLSFLVPGQFLHVQTLISKELQDGFYPVEVYRKTPIDASGESTWVACGIGKISLDNVIDVPETKDTSAGLIFHPVEPNQLDPVLAACRLIERSVFLQFPNGKEDTDYIRIKNINSIRHYSRSYPDTYSVETIKVGEPNEADVLLHIKVFDQSQSLVLAANLVSFISMSDEERQQLQVYRQGEQYHTWITAKRQALQETETSNEKEVSLESLLALKEDQRVPFLQTYLVNQISSVLRMPVNRIPLDKPINYLGLDSIMAIELKNGIEKRLKINLPVATLLQGPDIFRLAEIISSEIDRQWSDEVSLLEEHQVVKKTGSRSTEFSLTAGQRAMWLQHQVDPGSVFNPVQAVRIRARIDPEQFYSAFQALIELHPALRTTFTVKDGEPQQVIHSKGELSFIFKNIAALNQAEIQKMLADQGYQVFDLEKGPLLRVFLYQCAQEDYILMISAHHLVVDLWSLAILISDLSQILSNSTENNAKRPLDYEFIDFVNWQNEMLEGEEGDRLWTYWQEQLKGTLPVLDLPTDYPRPAIQTHNGAVRTVLFDELLSAKLQSLGERNGATLFMVLLAAYKALLFRYTGQEDIIIGTPTTGRSRQEFTEVIGYFVNSVPIKSHLGAEKRFVDYLSEIREVVVGALNHQDYPMPLLVERLHPDRDPSVLPLYQVMFAFQRAHLLYDEGLSQFAVGMKGFQMNLAGLPLESVVVDQKYTPFDLTLTMARTDRGLGASLSYNTDLFHPSTIDRLLKHFEVLLNGIVDNPEQEISKLPMLTPEEYHQLVVTWNNTQDKNPLDQNVYERFEEMVNQSPGATAITFEGVDVTYDELNHRANQLAHYLRRLGVGKDKIVGIFMERSPEMIVSILGIMKAGGAYLPLDPVHPYERLAFMLQDARVRLLMTQSSLMSRLPTLIAQPVFIDAHWGMISQESTENPGYDVDINDLAYIIYTSGSTGKSKGVMIQHRGLANLVNCHITDFNVDSTTNVLQFASCGFDASVMEIFMALGSGGKLVLARREVLLSVPDLYNLLAREEISTFVLPPSLLAMLPDENLPALRTPISGGESCSREIAERWSKGRTFINAYGPTETTVAPTYFRIDQISSLIKNVPIGKPIANNQVFILDKNLQPVPIGLPGELHVGGIGLARGYLNRPELTDEKFIDNPFYDISIKAGQKWSSKKLYKTGDLARFLPDGNIEYLGRIDFQVKVRGFRIELGEIESLIDQYPSIRHVVVIVREDEPGNKKIVAYVVPEPDQTIKNEELRRYLREKLPEYMIPSAFVVMDILPLNANGKVDRQALPSPSMDRLESEVAYVSPVTDIERTIANIWQEVLGVNRVGLNDNFFDLGGHSLLMAKAHARLQEALGREFSLIYLFRYPTVSTLAEYLTDGVEEGQSLKETAERADRQKEVIKKNVDRMRNIARNRPNFRPADTKNE